MKRDREKGGDIDVGPGNLLGGAGRSAYDDLDAAAARTVYDDRPQRRWFLVSGIASMQICSNSFSMRLAPGRPTLLRTRGPVNVQRISIFRKWFENYLQNI